MKNSNNPLSVSGRVFVDKLLALEQPSLAVPRSLQAGDFKVICVPKRHPSGVRGYVGFFAAYIWDGKVWRKFALREGAAFKGSYESDAERKRLAEELVRGLRKLKGKSAVCGDRAYWMEVQKAPPQPPPSAEPAVATVTPVAPVLPRATSAGAGTVRSRRRKGAVVDGAQMLLFK